MSKMDNFVFFTLVSLAAIAVGVHGASSNVQQEIDKIADKLSTFERPNEAVVNGFMEQIQAQCPNRTINESIAANMQECMQSKFNNTALEDDIRKAIPEGKLDEVFHDVCIKWPKAKECMHHIIDVIEDCWSQGEKVTRVMDSMVRFFCGNNNDGARIALFFADGGMRCTEARGEEVKECIMKKPPSSSPMTASQEDICASLTHIHNCAHKGFKKCDDPTPENLVTSMMKEVAVSVGCPKIPDPPSRHTSRTSASAILENRLSLLIAAIGFYFMVHL